MKKHHQRANIHRITMVNTVMVIIASVVLLLCLLPAFFGEEVHAKSSSASSTSDSPESDTGLFHLLSGMTREKLNFVPPVIHPFDSMEELRRESSRDPFTKFLPYDYYASTMQVDHAQQVLKMVKRSPAMASKMYTTSAIRTATSTMDTLELQATAHNRKIHLMNPLSGAKLQFESQSRIYPGVVLVDDEPSITSVQCSREYIDVHVSHSNQISRWIPGTRLILADKWKASCSYLNLQHSNPSDNNDRNNGTAAADAATEEDDTVFRMVMRREVKQRLSTFFGIGVSGIIVRFHTKPLKMLDMLLDSKYDLNYVPPRREDPETKLNADNTPSSVRDIFSISETMGIKNISQVQSSSSAPFSASARFDMGLINFNYDRQRNAPADASIDLVDKSYSNDEISSRLTAVCRNCYAYLGVGIKANFAFSLSEIHELKIMVGGILRMQYKVEVDASGAYEKTWTVPLLPKVPLAKVVFYISIIPVWIDLKFQVDGKVDVRAQLEARAIHTGSYVKESWFGIKYDGHSFQNLKEDVYSPPEFKLPELSVQGNLDVTFSLVPTLGVVFQNLLTSQFSLIPSFHIAFVGSASLEEDAVIRYSTAYQLQFTAQIVSLAITIPIWGTFDLSSYVYLPYPPTPYAIDIIPKTNLTCHFCTGTITAGISEASQDKDKVMIERKYDLPPVSANSVPMQFTLTYSERNQPKLYLNIGDKTNLGGACSTQGCTWSSSATVNVREGLNIKIHKNDGNILNWWSPTTVADYLVYIPYSTSMPFEKTIGGPNLILTIRSFEPAAKLVMSMLPSNSYSISAGHCHYFAYTNDQYSDYITLQIEGKVTVKYRSFTHDVSPSLDATSWYNAVHIGGNVFRVQQAFPNVLLSVCGNNGVTSYRFEKVIIKTYRPIEERVTRQFKNKHEGVLVEFDRRLDEDTRELSIQVDLRTVEGDVDAWCSVYLSDANRFYLVDSASMTSASLFESKILHLPYGNSLGLPYVIVRVYLEADRPNSKADLLVTAYHSVSLGAIVKYTTDIPIHVRTENVNMDEISDIVAHIEKAPQAPQVTWKIMNVREGVWGNTNSWSSSVIVSLGKPASDFVISPQGYSQIHIYPIIRLQPSVPSQRYPIARSIQQQFVVNHSKECQVDEFHVVLTGYAEWSSDPCTECAFSATVKVVDIIANQYTVLRRLTSQNGIISESIPTSFIPYQNYPMNAKIEIDVVWIWGNDTVVTALVRESSKMESSAVSGTIGKGKMVYHELKLNMMSESNSGLYLTVDAPNSRVNLYIGKPGVYPNMWDQGTILIANTTLSNVVTLGFSFNSPTVLRRADHSMTDKYYIGIYSEDAQTSYAVRATKLESTTIALSFLLTNNVETRTIHSHDFKRNGARILLRLQSPHHGWSQKLNSDSEQSINLGRTLISYLSSDTDSSAWNLLAINEMTQQFRALNTIQIRSSSELVLHIQPLRKYTFTKTQQITLSKTDPNFFSTDDPNIRATNSIEIVHHEHNSEEGSEEEEEAGGSGGGGSGGSGGGIGGGGNGGSGKGTITSGGASNTMAGGSRSLLTMTYTTIIGLVLMCSFLL